MKLNDDVTIRVNEQTKEEWEEHAEDPETRWKGVSDLVRGAVRYELNGTHVQQDFRDVLEEHSDLDQEEVVDAVDTALSDEFNRLQDNLADLDEQLRSSEATTELAQELRSNWLLPYPEEVTPVNLGFDPDTKDMMDAEAQARIEGSAKAYADVMGHSEQLIRRALRRAVKLYPNVKSVIVPETARKRYYIRDEDMEGPKSEGSGWMADMISSMIQNGGFQTKMQKEEQRGDS